MLSTFLLVVIGWTFFRAPDIATAGTWLGKMLTLRDLSFRQVGLGNLTKALPVILLFLLLTWFNRDRTLPRLPASLPLRWALYLALVFLILLWQVAPQTFIYFQF